MCKKILPLAVTIWDKKKHNKTGCNPANEPVEKSIDDFKKHKKNISEIDNVFIYNSKLKWCFLFLWGI